MARSGGLLRTVSSQQMTRPCGGLNLLSSRPAPYTAGNVRVRGVLDMLPSLPTWHAPPVPPAGRTSGIVSYRAVLPGDSPQPPRPHQHWMKRMLTRSPFSTRVTPSPSAALKPGLPTGPTQRRRSTST